LKLVVNAYLSILIEGVAETAELAHRMGVDPEALDQVIEGGPLDAPIAEAKLHKMEAGDYAPEFPLEWALKDVHLALQDAGDVPFPMLDALAKQWEAAVENGHGRQDISAARLQLRPGDR
jgi:3-hydroxyisobutyrate dehydrogenase